jgi:hypothetical protein
VNIIISITQAYQLVQQMVKQKRALFAAYSRGKSQIGQSKIHCCTEQKPDFIQAN